MERTLKPLVGYADMQDAIQSAGAWFIGSYMLEFVDSYEKVQNKSDKQAFIDYFFEEYYGGTDDRQQLCNRINCAIRLIESGMVEDAMEYVLQTNDAKLGCDESKVNAQFLLDRPKSGESTLPLLDE